MGGSMGSVVGEKFTARRRTRAGRAQRLVCFSATGGARMQEGAVLADADGQDLRRAGASARCRRAVHQRADDPTTGGVSASLGMLGDINIGEPKALIGFAGPRVIEQTVRETLPEGFQRSEFLVDHGAIDMIVDRREMRDKLAICSAFCARRHARHSHSQRCRLGRHRCDRRILCRFPQRYVDACGKACGQPDFAGLCDQALATRDKFCAEAQREVFHSDCGKYAVKPVDKYAISSDVKETRDGMRSDCSSVDQTNSSSALVHQPQRQRAEDCQPLPRSRRAHRWDNASRGSRAKRRPAR
jgi:hypothetical protein